MPTMRLLDLFSGVGGFSLGLEKSQAFTTVAFCEADIKCHRVLSNHWPEVPIYDDVRSLSAARLAADGIEIDAICGGFPCQDVSGAGQRIGIEGARSGLWSEYSRLIRELRPKYAIIENVSDLLIRGLDVVLSDLAACGYDALWSCIPASAVGAPHIRDRVWIIAYPSSVGSEGHSVADEGPATKEFLIGRGLIQGAAHAREANGWPVEPYICRVAYGVPARMDRLRQLGNAVVPEIPKIVGAAIHAYESSE